MPNNSYIEFRVGVIILLGLILLAGSLYWLQGYKLERNAQRILVRFEDVGSLAVGDRVTVSGVQKGKVNGLTLTQNGVVAELLIYNDVILSQDARFVIKNLGLMGERFIAITPGNGNQPIDTGKVISGSYDTGIPELIGSMGEMVEELRNLVTSLRGSVASDSGLNQLRGAVANLSRLSGSMADWMERNGSKLDATADNFVSASRGLNELISRNKNSVDSTVKRLDRVTVGMESLVNQLDTVAMAARTFSDALANEEGTARLLVEDRRLYDDLRKAADNLDDLITDIRTNPEKYINLKVEIF